MITTPGTRSDTTRFAEQWPKRRQNERSRVHSRHRLTTGLESLVLTVSEDNRKYTDMIHETWCKAVVDG
ncbi:hypothetical protein BB347_01350 [Natronorubrum daqingense]|uniref:Uncharacterized protein n=1 Tax=Natronorubrum daqingense TaxID=588898 RepID=A0A1P8R9M1_9EURY|nr:hypothetical protein BB347_01350 [Natronorubrum daqingense]